jgi:hypothetical protein
MLAGLLAAAVVLVGASVQARYGGDFDIGEFMNTAHKKANNFKARTQKAVKGMDWAEAEKVSKEWLGMAEKLPKAKPPKGEKASWDKLSGAYVKTVKGLHEAAEKKDAAKANGAITAINKACAVCHKAHR